MSSFESDLLRIVADPLAHARAAARAGQRVVGYVGAEVPVELILAAGAVPVRLSGRADEPTPEADQFFERAFMPEIRSIAEQWISGALDFIDAVVLPRGDDSAQRLYYYMCELQRTDQCGGPKPLIHDVAGVDRESSRAYTAASTAALARELGAKHGATHGGDNSGANGGAARAIGERDELLARLSDIRASDAPLLGSVAHRVARASAYVWTPEFRAELNEWLLAIPRSCRASAPSNSPRAGHRILLAGNSPPDERIHTAVEAVGATLVRELTDAKWFPLWQSSLARALARSPELIATEARKVRADGVVIWMIEENETLPWELPGQLRALQVANVPVLVLTRQPWLVADEALEAISQFAKGLAQERAPTQRDSS
jgi:2-hydroxyglutaryl-CoA dehydratase D-component